MRKLTDWLTGQESSYSVQVGRRIARALLATVDNIRADIDVLRRAAAEQDVSLGVGQPEMNAVAQRADTLRRLARQVGGDALGAGGTIRLPGAQHAGRRSRGANCGPEVEQRLGEVGRSGLGGGVCA